MAYIDEEPGDAGCVFCAKLKERDTRQALVVAQTKHSMVMLNKYPYNNGHLLLAPKRHERELTKLPAEEYSDLNEALRKSVDVIRNRIESGRAQSRHESGANGRCGHRRAFALARGPALGRRHELYADRGRNEGHAAAPARQL